MVNKVDFPGLGLSFNVNRVAVEVFGIPIYWYGIIIAAGFLLAVILGLRRSKKEDLDPDTIIDLVLFATPAAIVGARLYYVIFSWSDFKDNLLNIFNTRMGGLAIYGAIIGAFVTVFIYARVKKMSFLKFADFGSPYIVLAQSIGRWGNFVNQEAFGTNTSLPWGMTSPAVQEYLRTNSDQLAAQGVTVDPLMPVHPTFLYESLWDIATFIFLIWFRKRKKVQGEVFFLYLAVYGLGRFIIEGMRTDSLMAGSMRISQLLSALLIVVCIALFIARRRKAAVASEQEVVPLGESVYGGVLEAMKKEESEETQRLAAEKAGHEAKPETNAEEAQQKDETDLKETGKDDTDETS